MLLSLGLLKEGYQQLFAMLSVCLVYAAIIFKKKPFILFPLKLLLLDITVDFYNFLEFSATITTAFNLLLGTLAKLDTTQEASDSIGVVFVFTNALLVVLSVVSYEYGIHHNNSNFTVDKEQLKEQEEKRKDEEQEKINVALKKQVSKQSE